MLTEDSLAGWLRRSSRVPGFQSLVGFRIPSAVFRIAKPRIPVSTRKDSPILVSTTSKNFRDSLIRILLLGRFSRLLFSLSSAVGFNKLIGEGLTSNTKFVADAFPYWLHFRWLLTWRCRTL